jgi:hypothetical protein
MKEVWEDIKGFEGIYQVSNLGNVKSLYREIHRKKMGILIVPEKTLTPNVDKVGYARVTLYKKDFKYREFIHRLVAFSFIENTNNKPFINHKNGIKTDNIVDNLEWCTQKENVNHAYRTKLRIPDIGQSKGTSKLKNTDIPIIRKMLKESSHTYKEIGDIYKVSSSAIKLIKYNKNWVNF